MDVCGICGWQGDGQHYDVKEMMYGTEDAFSYFVCPECRCLQIGEVPKNLEDYYAKDTYYSYQKPNTEIRVEQTDMTRVLDVGCGAGTWLCALARNGLANLTGCDPYIPEELHYDNGVHIYKKTVHEMTGEYDRINFGDSFEHVSDPHEVMESIRRLLAPTGECTISIPIFPNIAFEMFGTSWYQWDAPRHLYLHSKESMNYLALKHGLQIVRMKYESSNSQFARSFLYKKGIPYVKQTDEEFLKYFTIEQLDDLQKRAEEANQMGYGDHAQFWLIHRAKVK